MGRRAQALRGRARRRQPGPGVPHGIGDSGRDCTESLQAGSRRAKRSGYAARGSKPMTPTSFSCVVDASVAAQLYVPEPLTSQAAALFAMLAQANVTFHIPDLFYAECANIFWKKVQRAVCT